jgi:predicted peptidase
MTQTAHEFEITRTHTIRLPYLLGLPPGYDNSQTWPLILFLHGAGERGHDLELLKLHGLPYKLARGDELPFVIVSPQCPPDTWWPEYHEALIGLLDEIGASHAVDSRRVYLTGLSMGGYGTWYLAQHYPERFAAIAPICGGMPWFVDAERAAECIKSLPAWVFHGAKDDRVPLKESQTMVDALQACGADVQFTVYPDLDHNSWTVTYDNPELYRWLLAHERR